MLLTSDPTSISTSEIVLGIIGVIALILFILAMFGDLIFGASPKDNADVAQWPEQ